MGTRGPVPKRSDQRQRRNRENEPITVTVVGEVPEAPAPDPGWHPIAHQYWDAFHASGQTRFWEPSDWALAYDLMEEITRYKESGRRSSQMRAAIDAGMARLMVSEADRRRVRLELQRDGDDQAAMAPAAPAEVTRLDEYRDLYG